MLHDVWPLVLRILRRGLLPPDDRAAVARALRAGDNRVLDHIAFEHLAGLVQVTAGGEAATAPGPDIAAALERSLASWRLVDETGALWMEVLPTDRRLVAGRSPGCDVQLPDRLVGRVQAIFCVDDDGCRVEDAGSPSGTWVGGEHVTAPRRLAPGVEVRLGGLRLFVEGPADLRAPPPAAPRCHNRGPSST